MSVKYSEFLGCYVVIYNDLTSGKTTIARKDSQIEADDFDREMKMAQEPQLSLFLPYKD